MPLKLRLSSSDRRAVECGRPILLLDKGNGNNTVVSSHRTSGNAYQAAVVLDKLHGYARDLSATQLHDLATAMCERLYFQSDYDCLPLSKQLALLEAARVELRSRRRF